MQQERLQDHNGAGEDIELNEIVVDGNAQGA
jgi:hypothetical protein